MIKLLIIILASLLLVSCQSGDIMTLYSEGTTETDVTTENIKDTTDTLTTTEAETEPPELPQGSLVVVSLTDTVKRGNTATISVNGLPNTEYSITVTYSSVSTAKGLENKVSDGDGNISWSWRVGNRTKPGKYKIEIQCQTEKITVYFTVTA